MLRNVAPHKDAFQVSTYIDEYGPHRETLANDGIVHTNYKVTSGGCAASNPATNPWWAVDLGAPTLVFMVKLTNREDAEFGWPTYCHCQTFVTRTSGVETGGSGGVQ